MEPFKNVGKPLSRVWNQLANVAYSMPQWKPTGKGISNYLEKAVQIVLWYLDSGCSRHMTGDRARLINFVEKFIGQFCGWRFRVAIPQQLCYIRNSDMVDLLKGSRNYQPVLLSLNDMIVSFTMFACFESLFNDSPYTTYGPLRTMRKDVSTGKMYVLVKWMITTRFGWVRFLRTKDENPQ
ncbi:hypothetical protein Tco_0535251 [Tanacetum coccineum]